jgi:D-beta-D-heptose 7-phosphate kinase/D-beta-D-heptose 1-phosphate adenosyltransferase
MNTLKPARVRQLLADARRLRVLVLGDVMLDRFLWGRVSRISPEAPVPVVEFERENAMPGGAANVARNLTALGSHAELFGMLGHDHEAAQLTALLSENSVGCAGLIGIRNRMTSVKTRVIASQQQVVRVDRETCGDLEDAHIRRLLAQLRLHLDSADAIIVGDYGKGVVTQPLLDTLKTWCRERGIWLSLDPKPVHHLDLRGISLITPNRKEAFEMAGMVENGRAIDPLKDPQLLAVADGLLANLNPAVLLITLGDQGMLLCRHGKPPFHIPTMAREVYDVSGAGDTVIASFTLAIAAGASPMEAAIFSNHAAGVVVGKFGTATVTPQELLKGFNLRK